jgi:amidophosphoribosyltransferase
MPTPSELVAHGRTIEEVREVIGCDALIYQDVEGMKRAVMKAAETAPGTMALDGFDASCFDGIYVTGDINAEDIARINEARIGQEDPLEEDTSRLALPNAQEV